MSATPGRPLVTAHGVGMRFGRTRVLDSVDLEVEPGAHIALTGRSGSGKSTLLLLLAGLLRPSQGRLAWPGLPDDEHERRARIGLVFQAPSLLPELTALQNVVLPLRLRGVSVDVADARARDALADLGIDDQSGSLPHQLSGGQQQRVAIARVLAGGHQLVLADEPTGSLDRAHGLKAALALRDGVAATGGSLVLATHDLELATMFDQQISVAERRVGRQALTS